jgi:hypothetical protein
MNNTHKSNWLSAPRERDTKPVNDWRDTAVGYVEWAASWFIGMLFWGFVSYYWGLFFWTSIVIGATMTFAAHWAMKYIAQKLT